MGARLAAAHFEVTLTRASRGHRNAERCRDCRLTNLPYPTIVNVMQCSGTRRVDRKGQRVLVALHEVEAKEHDRDGPRHAPRGFEGQRGDASTGALMGVFPL